MVIATTVAVAIAASASGRAKLFRVVVGNGFLGGTSLGGTAYGGSRYRELWRYLSPLPGTPTRTAVLRREHSRRLPSSKHGMSSSMAAFAIRPCLHSGPHTMNYGRSCLVVLQYGDNLSAVRNIVGTFSAGSGFLFFGSTAKYGGSSRQYRDRPNKVGKNAGKIPDEYPEEL